MKFQNKHILLLGLALAIGLGLSWKWWQHQHTSFPTDIASANGRIEADQVDITTKYAGRIKQVLVQEGDLVLPNQPLAIMDNVELLAQLSQAQAQVAQSQAAVDEGIAIIAQRKSELSLAIHELNRVIPLVQEGAVSQSVVDQKQSVRDSADAAVVAAQARLNTLKQSVIASSAVVTLIQTQIDDTTLFSPVLGRVLYRLAQPSEVLGSGGKVLTVLSLADIYMEVFLPSSQTYRTAIGAEARIKLDIIDVAIPGQVSFVSPESQFTPKQVETQSERDKLMFRVKVRIPQELVLEHIDQVKTGIRGVAYVRLLPESGMQPSPWPDFLQKLPEVIDHAESLQN